MHVATESPILGIEDRVLNWNATERKALARAAALLKEAREIVGPDSDLGTELGKAEMILWEYGDSVIFETRCTPVADLLV